MTQNEIDAQWTLIELLLFEGGKKREQKKKKRLEGEHFLSNR